MDREIRWQIRKLPPLLTKPLGQNNPFQDRYAQHGTDDKTGTNTARGGRKSQVIGRGATQTSKVPCAYGTCSNFDDDADDNANNSTNNSTATAHMKEHTIVQHINQPTPQLKPPATTSRLRHRIRNHQCRTLTRLHHHLLQDWKRQVHPPPKYLIFFRLRLDSAMGKNPAATAIC